MFDITNPRYDEQISPIPWHFVNSRFHCISCFEKKYFLGNKILSQQHVERVKLGVITKSFYVSHTCISFYLLSPIFSCIFEGPHLCTVVYHKLMGQGINNSKVLWTNHFKQRRIIDLTLNTQTRQQKTHSKWTHMNFIFYLTLSPRRP